MGVVGVITCPGYLGDVQQHGGKSSNQKVLKNSRSLEPFYHRFILSMPADGG